MPRATVKMALLLADIMEAAPVPAVPFMPPPMPPIVPFMSMPPVPAVETGEVFWEAFLADFMKASRVFSPLAGALMTPTIPAWQCSAREQ